jgi:hypothetical protein
VADLGPTRNELPSWFACWVPVVASAVMRSLPWSELCAAKILADIGDAIEHGGDEGKFTESELQEYGQALRAEGVEAGIKIGMARKSNGNGHITLPEPSQMAEYCHDRLSRLKDDKQREFVSDIYTLTRRKMSLSLGRLGYLVSIYIQHGGRI